MAQTIAEKILARVSRDGLGGPPGAEIAVKPDFVLAYDFPGYLDTWFRQMREEYGVTRVREPERFAMFIDHMTPGATPDQERVHEITRAWCREQGVPLFERAGIGHHVAVEEGYAVPGTLSIHFDGHTAQLGAYGALSIGVHKRVLEALVRDYIRIRVPHTIRVDLEGRLPPGLMARDVFHELVRQFGPAFCRFQVLELGGGAIDAMDFDGRQTITGLAMFAGAVTAIVNPDARVLAFAAPRARRTLEPLRSDPDCAYAARFSLDVSALRPLVVPPPSPAAARPVEAFPDLPVHVGYIGSCSSGRLEDLRAAAHVLRGRRVREGFKLNVVATSRAILARAAAEGLVETLVTAGAHVVSPTCDYCYGLIPTVADRQVAVSSGTLNTPGRMGSTLGEIYLCSAATVAATALHGRLTDPRPYFEA